MMTPASVMPMFNVGESAPPPEAGRATAAKPKSGTLKSPAGVNMMLAGFKSRFVVPSHARLRAPPQVGLEPTTLGLTANVKMVDGMIPIERS